jgi:Na+/H+ antiporter NhaC
MMPTLAILAGAFTVARCCNAMHLPEYVISTVQPFVTPQTYPMIIFLVVSVLTFATSSTWGISTIVIPIIIPLAAAVDANLILTMAAILSGSTFGSHACFYSDATVLASAASRIENMEHAFTQIPYAAIGAALTCVCLLVSGFVLG